MKAALFLGACPHCDGRLRPQEDHHECDCGVIVVAHPEDLPMNTIGTCSICGGPVQLPAIWHGIVPPQPTCGGCGAVAASYGPIVPMRPSPMTYPKTGSSIDTEWMHNLPRTVSEGGAA